MPSWGLHGSTLNKTLQGWYLYKMGVFRWLITLLLGLMIDWKLLMKLFVALMIRLICWYLMYNQKVWNVCFWTSPESIGHNSLKQLKINSSVDFPDIDYYLCQQKTDCSGRIHFSPHLENCFQTVTWFRQRPAKSSAAMALHNIDLHRTECDMKCYPIYLEKGSI